MQIDLEEAIANAEKNDKLNGNNLNSQSEKDKFNDSGNYIYEEIEQQEVDEGEARYKFAKELEMKLANGEQINEEELTRLRNYQNTGEYISKKDRETNLEEFNIALEESLNSTTNQ